MGALKVLFIGGTGTISGAASALAVERGIDLTVLNRGNGVRALPDGARSLIADARDPVAMRAVLGGAEFDVVVDWVAFTPEHVRGNLECFEGRVGQYVFISSASTYQTPPARLPIRESTPLYNPVWKYSRDKIACEDLLVLAYRERGFPVTIVRPSHTYDRASIPLHGGWTMIERMRQGREIVVHGDGSSLWTLTHSSDFAPGLIGLLGNSRALGEAFTITSDDVLNWNQIAEILAAAAGVEARIVHVPSEQIAAIDCEWGDSLLGDKTWSAVFDTSKLRALVPDFRPVKTFEQGAREIVEWHDVDPARHRIDAQLDAVIDRLVERFRVSG